MKLVLTLLVAIAFALIFERRRVAAYLRERRVQRWSRMTPALLDGLYTMGEALQQEQGQVDLAFDDAVDGQPLRFLFSNANGRLQLRISGERRRLRLAARNRGGPLWLDVSPPRPKADEPGLDDDAFWDYGRSEEAWASVTDGDAHDEGVALAETFLRIWRNHIDRDMQETRRAAWRGAIATIDRAALDRVVHILARGREDAARDGWKAIEARWNETAAEWQLIEAKEHDRNHRARLFVWDGLSDAGVIAAFDFKSYEADYIGSILLAGLPFGDALIAGLSDEGDFFDKIAAFDQACQPHGYRLVKLDFPYDDYEMVVVASRDLDELNALTSKLGLGSVVTADRINH